MESRGSELVPAGQKAPLDFISWATIADCLAERAGREVSIGTLYNTLVRLEERRLVESEMGDPTPVRGGKAKRLFRVTEAGDEALAEARAVMERMWEGLPVPDAG